MGKHIGKSGGDNTDNEIKPPNYCTFKQKNFKRHKCLNEKELKSSKKDWKRQCYINFSAQLC